MVLRHLLDSDVAIEILRGRHRELLHTVAQHEELGLSTISVAELSYGLERSRHRRQVERVEGLLAALTILGFDQEAAREAGVVRAELAAAGEQIGPYDQLIAGHARSRGLVLVTRNVREFERVPGLRVERW